MKTFVYDLNDDGRFVDHDTGELVPVEIRSSPDPSTAPVPQEPEDEEEPE